MKKVAVYPGSFDPITNGHLDILARALKIFDEVVILVAINPNKKGLFDVNEKINLIKEATKYIKGVKVAKTDGLSIDYAKKIKAKALIRGLRAVSDFEYEFALSASNEYINKDIEMLFFMAHKETSFISSSSIIELYKNGVDITPLVPKCVINELKKKF